MRRLVVACLVMVLLAAGAWVGLRDGPEESMAAFVAELRARGEPVTLADMEPPMPPRDQNGARDIDRAFLWLDGRLARESRDLGARWWMHYVGPWNRTLARPWFEAASSEELDELRSFLDTLTPFWDSVAEAARTPEIAWPLAPSAPNGHFFGSAQRYEAWRLTRELLAARAVTGVGADERIAAMASLLACDRRIRVHSALAQISTGVFRKLGCTALRDGIESGRLNAVAARRRIDGLLRGPGVESMPRVLHAHRVLLIENYSALLDGSLQASFRSTVRMIERGLGGKRPSRVQRMGDAIQNAVAGVRFDWREYLDALRRLDSVIPADGSWEPASERALAAYSTSTGDKLLQRYLGLLRAAATSEALARVALAACEYRRDRGDWPASCSALAPLFPDGVPLDPYTGRSFVMERDGGTLVLRAAPPKGSVPESDGTLRERGLEWRLPPR